MILHQLIWVIDVWRFFSLFLFKQTIDVSTCFNLFDIICELDKWLRRFLKHIFLEWDVGIEKNPIFVQYEQKWKKRAWTTWINVEFEKNNWVLSSVFNCFPSLFNDLFINFTIFYIMMIINQTN